MFSLERMTAIPRPNLIHAKKLLLLGLGFLIQRGDFGSLYALGGHSRAELDPYRDVFVFCMPVEENQIVQRNPHNLLLPLY